MIIKGKKTIKLTKYQDEVLYGIFKRAFNYAVTYNPIDEADEKEYQKEVKEIKDLFYSIYKEVLK
jgi:hypothetical protein